MSSLHHNTPTLTVVDPRGLTVRSVAYPRNTAQQSPSAQVTRQVFDARGLLQQQWDPRLFELHAADPDVRPNLSHRYSLSGQVLSTDSADAGRQTRLLGSGGQVVQQWDSRGTRQRFEYDPLLRPVAGETRYFVVTTWASEEDFQAWRDGGARAAHAPSDRKPVASGASLLEFEVVDL